MKSKLRFVGAGAVLVLLASFIAPAYAADNPVKLVAPKEIVGIPAIPFTGLKAQAFSCVAKCAVWQSVRSVMKSCLSQKLLEQPRRFQKCPQVNLKDFICLT